MRTIFLFFISLCIGIAISLLIFFLYKKPFSIKQTQQIEQVQENHFSLQQAPSESLQGVISSLSGNVAWQSRIATIPATITKAQSIQQGEELTTADTGNVVVQFASVGTITMAPITDVSFIQTLPANFAVQQATGIATYHTISTHPFSIRSLHVLLTQTSADTNITVDKNRPIITIKVNQGVVTTAFNDLQDVSTVITVPAGTQLIFNDTTRQALKKPLL